MMKMPITVKGMEKLRRDLEKLKNEDRPQIAKAIGEARALGDLKENAEYHAAREKQGFIEARIRDLESKIANANVIDISKIPHNNIVVFGTTVHVLEVDTGKEMVYQLVGDVEADIENGKISINTPIARSLVGKKPGDIAMATVPTGVIELEILEIEYSN